jgi:hypothetical protein
MKVRVNQKSLSAKIKGLETQAEEQIKTKLVDIAEDLTLRTPVDTGAYAESFSVVPASSGGGRRRDSHGRPRRQDPGTYRSIALSNMTSDIEGLQLLENRSVSFRNRAPHADVVENKYQVFGAAKDRNR